MFDDEEFLDASRHLRSTDVREGFQRSAISRAYYAAFLHARRVFRERGEIASTGSGSDHGTVASALSQFDMNLGSDFKRLQHLRRIADYSEQSLDVTTLADNAQLAIDLAEFIRTELQRLR